MKNGIGPASLAEHLASLEGVLNTSLKLVCDLNKENCAFLLEQMEYFGHMTDALGGIQMKENLEPLLIPLNVKELCSFWVTPQLLQPFPTYLISKDGTPIPYMYEDK